MTDPSQALESFQKALSGGQIQVQRCELDPEMYVHLDQPNDQTRFTYVRLDRRTVTSLVMFVMIKPIERTPCFHIGYAVPSAYRRQGRAKSAVEAAIAEMKNGFARANITTFYVEAVIGEDNEASRHVADATISKTSVLITDDVSGLPALQYLRKIEKSVGV